MFYASYISICFINDTATTEIYTYWHTLSLHDALPISRSHHAERRSRCIPRGQSCAHEPREGGDMGIGQPRGASRSEEHTSELQSLMRISYAVFCLKKKKYIFIYSKNLSQHNNNHLNHIQRTHMIL